jgi:hypothetical protein
MPIDFVAEVLWPGHLHDRRERHFDLAQAEPPAAEALIGRAIATKERALNPRE